MSINFHGFCGQVNEYKQWKQECRMMVALHNIPSKVEAGQQMVLTGVKPMIGCEALVRGTAPIRLDIMRKVYIAGLAYAARSQNW